MSTWHVSAAQARNTAMMSWWSAGRELIKVRAEVSKALEQARVQKVIGHSLDAAVAIAAPAGTGRVSPGIRRAN